MPQQQQDHFEAAESKPPGMAMSSSGLTSAGVIEALSLLDKEVGKSELLMSVAPIRLITVGGCLAVCLLGNRETCKIIDSMLDPNVAAVKEYVDAFESVVKAVTANSGLAKDWLRHDLGSVIYRPKREKLFLASVEQGISIYSGENLCLFAAQLDWALERNVRGIGYGPKRWEELNINLPDSAALVKFMVEKTGQPLTFDYVSGLNYNGFDAEPTNVALIEIAAFYIEKYGSAGLVHK